ncbi:hypothetical protein Tco_1167865 [Tanacetum coccineum]
MTCSTVKKLTKPLDEPEREFRRLRKATMRSHENESLAIAGRNLFDDEASSSNNIGAKPPTPPKTLHKHSRPNSFGIKNEDPLRHVKHYLSIVDNIRADGATRDTYRLRFFHFSLTGKAAEWLDRISLTQITMWDHLKQVCLSRGDIYNEVDEYELNNPCKQVCLSGGDIYDDPSLIRFYQNDDTLPWGNNKCKEKKEDDPD